MIDDVIWMIIRGGYTLLCPFSVVEMMGHKFNESERGFVSYYMGRKVKYLGNDKFYIYD